MPQEDKFFHIIENIFSLDCSILCNDYLLFLSFPSSKLRTITTFLTGGPRPTDIAIDWLSRTIFIAFAQDGIAAPGELSVSTLSGEFRKTLLSDAIITPISIAVSPTLGKIVWSDIGHTRHRIEIASANGRDRTVLADESSSLDFRLPKSLTFGHGPFERHLFWISRTSDKVQFCVIGPGGKPCLAVQTLSSAALVAPLAISYYEQSLLVAVGRFDPAIGIFNLTTEYYRIIRADTPSVVSVKMFSPLVQQGRKFLHIFDLLKKCPFSILCLAKTFPVSNRQFFYLTFEFSKTFDF